MSQTIYNNNSNCTFISYETPITSVICNSTSILFEINLLTGELKCNFQCHSAGFNFFQSNAVGPTIKYLIPALSTSVYIKPSSYLSGTFKFQ